MIHDLFPDTYMCHRVVGDMLSSKLKTGDVRVLDVGGIGRLQFFCKASPKTKVTDYNEPKLGCKLPYEDNTFDAVVSINTFEHVLLEKRPTFFYEAIRVAKNEVILVFPFNDYEGLKEKIEHSHLSCNQTIPTLEEISEYTSTLTGYSITKQFMCPITWHIAVLAGMETLEPVYDYINKMLEANPKLWFCTEPIAYLVILRINKNDDR